MVDKSSESLGDDDGKIIDDSDDEDEDEGEDESVDNLQHGQDYVVSGKDTTVPLPPNDIDDISDNESSLEVDEILEEGENDGEESDQEEDEADYDYGNEFLKIDTSDAEAGKEEAIHLGPSVNRVSIDDKRNNNDKDKDDSSNNTERKSNMIEAESVEVEMDVDDGQDVDVGNDIDQEGDAYEDEDNDDSQDVSYGDYDATETLKQQGLKDISEEISDVKEDLLARDLEKKNSSKKVKKLSKKAKTKKKAVSAKNKKKGLSRKKTKIKTQLKKPKKDAKKVKPPKTKPGDKKKVKSKKKKSSNRMNEVKNVTATTAKANKRFASILDSSSSESYSSAGSSSSSSSSRSALSRIKDLDKKRRAIRKLRRRLSRERSSAGGNSFYSRVREKIRDINSLRDSDSSDSHYYHSSHDSSDSSHDSSHESWRGSSDDSHSSSSESSSSWSTSSRGYTYLRRKPGGKKEGDAKKPEKKREGKDNSTADPVKMREFMTKNNKLAKVIAPSGPKIYGQDYAEDEKPPRVRKVVKYAKISSGGNCKKKSCQHKKLKCKTSETSTSCNVDKVCDETTGKCKCKVTLKCRSRDQVNNSRDKRQIQDFEFVNSDRVARNGRRRLTNTNRNFKRPEVNYYGSNYAEEAPKTKNRKESSEEAGGTTERATTVHRIEVQIEDGFTFERSSEEEEKRRRKKKRREKEEEEEEEVSLKCGVADALLLQTLFPNFMTIYKICQGVYGKK